MKKYLRFFSVLVVIVCIVLLNIFIHTNREYFLLMEKWGIIGVFLICLFLNATVLLPSSSTAIVVSMAAVYNPLIVAVVGALGASLGEFTGYYAGYYGEKVLAKANIHLYIINIFKKMPDIAVFLFALLPLPLFDILGILSGSQKVNKTRFFLFCFLGKTIKMICYAFLGLYLHSNI